MSPVIFVYILSTKSSANLTAIHDAIYQSGVTNKVVMKLMEKYDSCMKEATEEEKYVLSIVIFVNVYHIALQCCQRPFRCVCSCLRFLLIDRILEHLRERLQLLIALRTATETGERAMELSAR